jgi:hypothetical protein
MRIQAQKETFLPMTGCFDTMGFKLTPISVPVLLIDSSSEINSTDCGTVSFHPVINGRGLSGYIYKEKVGPIFQLEKLDVAQPTNQPCQTAGKIDKLIQRIEGIITPHQQIEN